MPNLPPTPEDVAEAERYAEDKISPLSYDAKMRRLALRDAFLAGLAGRQAERDLLRRWTAWAKTPVTPGSVNSDTAMGLCRDTRRLLGEK